MKVGDEVEYCSRSGEKYPGVVIEVAPHSYGVRWYDGSTSAEEYDDKYSGVRLKEDRESYIQAIQNKYPEEDIVNKPKHYMLFPEYDIEVRDLMILLANQLDDNGYSGILISDYIQAMQYLLRWHNKNGAEDVRKAKFYIDKIIEELDNGDFL